MAVRQSSSSAAPNSRRRVGQRPEVLARRRSECQGQAADVCDQLVEAQLLARRRCAVSWSSVTFASTSAVCRQAAVRSFMPISTGVTVETHRSPSGFVAPADEGSDLVLGGATPAKNNNSSPDSSTSPGSGHDHAVADHGDQHGVRRHADRASGGRPADCLRAESVSPVRMSLPQPHQPDEVPDVDGALDPRDHRRGVETATSMPHAWVNSQSFRMSLILATTRAPRTRTWPAAADAGSTCRRRWRRSPRRRSAVPPPPATQLAGVGQQPVGIGNRVRFEVAAVVLDQQDLVAVVEQLRGDGRPRYPHRRSRCASSPLVARSAPRWIPTGPEPDAYCTTRGPHVR